jgi:L-gulonolactone oxidase
MADAPSPRRFVNWGRTASCRAAHWATPRSEAELLSALRAAAAAGQPVKLVGAGHSWSDCACSTGHLINLDGLSRVVDIDPGRGEVTVEAGLRLWQLNEALAEKGLALGVLGSIAQQSVAGAISTGTHGSSPRRGNLASLVTGLRLALADGSVVDCSREQRPELFAAARVGLGALGAITQVTLRCEPAFRLEERAWPLRFDQALAAIPQLVENLEYVKLWWLPHTDHVQVFSYARTDAPSGYRPSTRWLDEKVVNRGLFALLLACSRLAPPIIPSMNQLVRRAYFRPVRRVARSDQALTIAMPARHQEVEYALPITLAAEALRRTRELIEAEHVRVNFVVELRFAAADDAWLSPAHGRDSCHLGAYMARAAGLDRYFSAFEREMLTLGGRPHWGKQFQAAHAELQPRYPRWEEFAALRRRLDPGGLFENDYLRRLFPAAPAIGAHDPQIVKEPAGRDGA